jgi:serine/threonine-protein kinase
MNRIGPIQLFAEIKRRENRVTYRGLDTESGRIVLVKIFAPASVPDEAALARFQQEAAIYASLDHPNVVKLVKFGVAESRPYLALEFVEGQNLRALLLQRSPLPNDVAISITFSLLAGSAEIHRHEIIHRDLKPENIMIGHDGVVKICDFDLAIANPIDRLEQDAHTSADRSLSTGHWLSGSPGYFSPEAILGEPLTPRSDLFAAGVILYEMFTGAKPFAAPTTSGEMNAVIRLPHLAPSKLNRAIPAEIEQLINALLAKSPAERPKSAEAVLNRLMERFPVPEREQTLRRYLDDIQNYQSAIVALPATTPGKPAARRANMAWRIAAVVTFVVFVASIFYLQFIKPTEASRNDQSATALETVPRADSLQRTVEKISATGNSLPRQPGAKVEAMKTARESASTIATETKAPLQRAIVVRSVPWAYLFVNGDSLGQAPRATPPLLTAQNHTFVFKKPNFPTLSYRVKIDSTTADTLVFSLWERVAQVEIRINPWAEFYLNGELQDASAKNPTLVLLPGEHHLRFKNPGLGEKTEALFLRAGETRRLEVNMFQRPRQE